MDAVIIGPFSVWKKTVSIERQRAILEQQLEELTDGIMDLKRNRGENFSIKQLGKVKKSSDAKSWKKLNDQSRKTMLLPLKNSVWTDFYWWESLLQEPYLYTKMRNVGGIAQTEAQKSSDLFMKCRYLDELTVRSRNGICNRYSYLKQYGGTLYHSAILAVQHACKKQLAALRLVGKYLWRDCNSRWAYPRGNGLQSENPLCEILQPSGAYGYV